jgi:hypothetical protein
VRGGGLSVGADSQAQQDEQKSENPNQTPQNSILTP